MTTPVTHPTSLVLALCAAGLLVTLLPDPTRQRIRRIMPVTTSRPVRTLVARFPRRLIRRRASDGRSPDTDGDAFRLAATWDVLAASLHAGMPIPDAVRAAAGNAPGRVAGTFLRTADLLALGAEPTQAWQQARACPETSEFARAACRTARSGTTLAETAATLAVRVRAASGDRAQARAQRAGVLMTGPLGLCFLPAFLCLGVIPVVIGLAGQLTVLG